VKKTDPYAETYEVLHRQAELVKELNQRVPLIFEQAMLRKWRTETKTVDKRIAARFMTAVIEAIEVSHKHGPTNTRSRRGAILHVGHDMPRKQIRSLLKRGIDIWSTSYHLTEFMRDMSLVYLVSQFESVLQKLLKISLVRWPEALSREKTITAEELGKCAALDEVKAALIEKEVASVMQGDIDAIDKYFRQKWGVQMSKSRRWNTFRERFYRRNIIVHNLGWVNRPYRQKTGYVGKEARMCVSRKYLLESIKLFDETALMLTTHFRKR
jgi:hypothetical protein